MMFGTVCQADSPLRRHYDWRRDDIEDYQKNCEAHDNFSCAVRNPMLIAQPIKDACGYDTDRKTKPMHFAYSNRFVTITPIGLFLSTRADFAHIGPGHCEEPEATEQSRAEEPRWARDCFAALAMTSS
jgi:hypothetical protein